MLMKPHPSGVDPDFLAFQSAVAGRYSIDRELGRGGMGIVYLAHEVHLDRLVAIKLLPPDKAADPLLRDRFLREARHAARLSHPHIIPIHSVAESGEFVFFVMAYIEGETLANRVRTRGPLVGSNRLQQKFPGGRALLVANLFEKFRRLRLPGLRSQKQSELGELIIIQLADGIAQRLD
jgi:hypothetical protein